MLTHRGRPVRDFAVRVQDCDAVPGVAETLQLHNHRLSVQKVVEQQSRAPTLHRRLDSPARSEGGVNRLLLSVDKVRPRFSVGALSFARIAPSTP